MERSLFQKVPWHEPVQSPSRDKAGKTAKRRFGCSLIGDLGLRNLLGGWFVMYCKEELVNIHELKVRLYLALGPYVLYDMHQLVYWTPRKDIDTYEKHESPAVNASLRFCWAGTRLIHSGYTHPKLMSVPQVSTPEFSIHPSCAPKSAWYEMLALGFVLKHRKGQQVTGSR